MDNPNTVNSETEWFVDRVLLNQTILTDAQFLATIKEAERIIVSAILSGKKLLIFGNGGSAAEAQHFAAELVANIRSYKRVLPAIALTTDTSVITAISNDISFDYIFLSQINAFCVEGDVAIGLTTSDCTNNHSKNILAGFERARELKAHTIGLFSQHTITLRSYVDIAIRVPSGDTALIQETHLAIIHYWCRQIEKAL